MIRRASEARFEKIGRKYRLLIGSGMWPSFESKKGLTEQEFAEVNKVQVETPLFVRFEPRKSKSLWLYGGRFWWADPELDEREVKALAEESFDRDERRLRRAMEKLDEDGSE